VNGPAAPVYLDHAATTATRPAAVVRAVIAYLEEIGATPGRGGHRLAIAAERVVLRCRQGLAGLLDIPGDAGRIAFSHNATHALNTALWGVLRPGDRVVITVYDHNAVLRPVHRLARERGVEARTVPGDAAGELDDVALARALDGARLLVINGASNVLGTVPDIAALTARAHAAGALVLLDAAQLAGHVPFSTAASDVDLLALTGHKALLGPQGTGALWVHPRTDIEPLLAGGTGGDSLDPEMPAAFPDRLEAGTLNGPGIAGLAAGVDLLEHETVERVHDRLATLKATLRDGLLAIDGVRVLSPAAPGGVPIVTITIAGLDPAALALRLDREHGVLARAGLHCAPGVHRLLGTEAAGALRFSLGIGNTEADVLQALRAVAAILGKERA
jgi:selenocysteine lyase/cysteine desulfurase